MMIVRGWDSSMAWRMTNVVRIERIESARFRCQKIRGYCAFTFVAYFSQKASC